MSSEDNVLQLLEKGKEGNPPIALKNYEDLTFADDFLFCKILSSNPELAVELLETILDISIDQVEYIRSQQPVEISPYIRGVRFDVYVRAESICP